MFCKNCGSLIKLLDNRCSICGGEPSLNNKIEEDMHSNTYMYRKESNSSQEEVEEIDLDEKYNMHFFDSDNWESIDRSTDSNVNSEEIKEVISDKEKLEELVNNEYEKIIEVKKESENDVSSYEYYELLESEEDALKNRKVEELYWENNNKNNNDVVEVDEDIKNFNPEKIRKEQEEFNIQDNKDKKINTALNIFFYATVGIVFVLLFAIKLIFEIKGKFVSRFIIIFGLILKVLVVKVKGSLIENKTKNAYLYLILAVMITCITIYFLGKFVENIRQYM
ncbi:MAG: hypothetical protein ACRDA5_04785 [Clostridium sp.]